MAGTVTYNLEHAQVALVGASPVYLDVPGVTTLDATISTSVNYFAGDGAKKYAAWSAPEGGGSLGFAEADFAVLEVINGGTASTAGTTPTTVERYVQPATRQPTNFTIATYASNENPNAAMAGFRIILPSASAGIASIASGQETWGEWTADLAFTGDDDDQMIIYEKLETKPTMTGDVFADPLAAA